MATFMDLMMGRAPQQLGQAGQSRMQLPAVNLPSPQGQRLYPMGRPDLLELMQGNNGSVFGGQNISQFELPGVPALPRVQFQQPQAAAPTPQLPSMMAYAPNQFGGLNTAPAVAPAAAAPVAPIQSATSTTAPASPSIFNRIFSGTDYQSNSMPVVGAVDGQGGAQFQQTVNWGDPNNAADYFRAAAAAQRIGLL